MTRLKSSITLPELETLIKDVASGNAYDYTFIGLDDKAYVTTHEIVFNSDQEVTAFSKAMQTFLTGFFGKKVQVYRYRDHADAAYSVFTSILTSQGGLIRLTWLDGKILSLLAGSKPYIILEAKEKDITKLSFSSYFFGFASDCEAAKKLTDEDKAALMAVPNTSWFVHQPKGGVTPNNAEANKSMSVAEGYVRHGSMEKLAGNTDTFFLLYPKQSSSYFSSDNHYGSSLPGLVSCMANFEYSDLLENQAILTGDGNRYGDNENTVFMNLKDVSPFVSSRNYIRFSFNAVTEFFKSKSTLQTKDLISRKYSVLTEEDTKKYTNNPRYDIVTSPDGIFSYIRKSDKLKATALQTRITKSLREDFIAFLNWLFYFQLAADLEPANMHETFAPVVLYTVKEVKWLDRAMKAFNEKKEEVYKLANEEYRTLYMGESESGVTPYTDAAIFNQIFQEFGSGSYHYNDTDPRRIMRYFAGSSDANVVSFNKKFSLNINLPSIMLLFARGKDDIQQADKGRIFFTAPSNLMSFMTTNFMMTTPVEDAIENKVKDADIYGMPKTVLTTPFWHFQYEENLKDGQLLKTTVSLSPEALMIFNSVANFNTPTDIISWLDLAKEYFITTLPGRLVTKYGDKIGTEQQLSALFYTGIEYYLTILSAAEPFSNKMLNTDETGD